jgi:hypothetical protein
MPATRGGEAKMSRMSLFKELWLFMKVGKKWWLGPLLFVLVLLGLLLVVAQGSALAPFIYALF